MSGNESEYDVALQDLFSCQRVATTEEVCDAISVAVQWGREWATANKVDRIANSFAWTLEVAQQFAEEVETELEGDDDEDGDDDDDDAAEDDDEDDEPEDDE